MSKKNLNWFNIIVAIIILAAGAVIFLTFDSLIIKVLGILAAALAFGFIITQLTKKKSNIDLNNEFNSDNNGKSVSANESLGLDDNSEIKIKNFQKAEPETKAEINTDENKKTTDADGLRIDKDSSQAKYSYGETSTAKLKSNETVASVRDTETDTFTETAYDTGVFLQEEQGRIIGSRPRKEFEYFVSRILLVLRSLTKSKTAVFAVVDKKTGKFTVESFVTNSPDAVKPNSTYNITNDVISKTINTEEAQILSEINPNTELDLLPYYEKHVGTLSIAAFPVFGWEGISGVLCLDSTFAGGFTSQTGKLVDKFTELLSAVVFSYINKYELLQAAKTLEAITLFYYKSNSTDIKKITQSLLRTVADIFECDACGVSLYDERKRQWVIADSFGEKHPFYSEGCVAEYDKSVIGQSIKDGMPVIYDYSAKQPNIKHRVCDNEPNLDSGSFTSIPIVSDNNTYGALYLIDKEKKTYTDYELEILKTLSFHVGLCIDKIELLNIFNNSAVMDIDTRMLNTLAFNHRLEDEIQRAKDFETNLVLCLFRLDKYSSIDWNSSDLCANIFESLFNNTQKKLRIYDLFGNVDSETYGVVLIDYSKADAKVWAESLRKDTANTVLDCNGKKVSVTFSMGLADLKEGDNLPNMLNKANKALIEAQKTGNKVSTF
jgi:diguanylate cyclase (GGDEF)-like protein